MSETSKSKDLTVPSNLEHVVSKSEPDLTTADRKNWNSGFPPGVSVDELRLYRKKRPPVQLRRHDNLRPEEGSFKNIVSEYTNKFKDFSPLSKSCGDIPLGLQDIRPIPTPRPEDQLKLEGERDLPAEYFESFLGQPVERAPDRRPRYECGNMDNIHLGDDGPAVPTFITEIQTKFVRHENVEKPRSLRRPTQLKLEGDLLTTTESAEKFIAFLLASRAALARKPTTLKLEGEMDVKTESREQFVPLEYQRRPPLSKKDTNLHLEGSLDLITEKTEKYVPFEVSKRAPLAKRESNLHLEGDLVMSPEYRDVFKEFKLERSLPSMPQNNLKPEGAVDLNTETISKYSKHQIHPTIPFLRGIDSSNRLILGDDRTILKPEYKENFVKHQGAERAQSQKPEEHLKQEGTLETTTESKKEFVEKYVIKTETKKAANNLLLEGRIDMNPEYRNAYIDYYREAKPSPLRRGKKGLQTSQLRAEGEIEVNPEYRSSYIDFPRERPRVRRPREHLHSEGDVEHITEKNAQFVRYPIIPKTQSLKREPELKLEGRFECQPEYRKAYIDYLIRERMDRKPRPLDNLGVQPTRAFEIMDANANGVKEKDGGKKDVAQPSIQATATQLEPQGQEQLTEQTQDSTQQPKPISRLESSLFGPKLEVPGPAPIKGSRSASPLPPSRRGSVSKSQQTDVTKAKPPPSRRNSSTTRLEVPKQAAGRSRTSSPSPSRRGSVSTIQRRRMRSNSRFNSPVRVENLACKTPKPGPQPVVALPPSDTRQRWLNRQANEERAKAFLVLEEEMNNNNVSKCDKNSNYASFYKEQKWMSPWYNPPS